MSKWRPIATAPKNGTWTLLTGGTIRYGWGGKSQPKVVVGQSTNYFNGRTHPDARWWQFAWYDGGYYGEYEEPTLWMPIPRPPKAPDAGPEAHPRQGDGVDQ